MRGIEREEKAEVVNLLKQGVPPSVIVKSLTLPMSTVCDWAKEVRKENRKVNKVCEKTDFMKSLIKRSAIKISNSISFVTSPEISDAQWFEVEKTIHDELNCLVENTIEAINDNK